MELKIDGTICDLGTDPVAVPGYDAARLADIDACREGRSLKLTLPFTPRNDAATGFSRDAHAAPDFNASLHRAELSADGTVLFAGQVRLLGVGDEGYAVELREGGAEWARDAAMHTLDELEIAYAAPLTPATVESSWTDETPVKFFPVRRDEYEQQNASTDLLPVVRMLSVDDYHPFLHIATLVEAIFRRSGYRLQSRFFESEFFRSLYMSGNYASRDTTALAARMGFFARRLKPATATADSLGRVWANPKAATFSVGNLVETATPQSLDADGEPVPELCNNGGCFGLDNGRIRFRPLTELSAGFECSLKYTTDHRILDRTRLRGFDSFYLGPGTEMRFSLPNRYRDRRPELTPGYGYRAVVFDHAQGAEYRLTCSLDGAANTLWTTFAGRTAAITAPADAKLTDAVLWRRSGSSWSLYGGDWALYDGYIGETGRTTVEVRLRSAAEPLSPGSPKYFDQAYFFGAEPGMSLTLHKECSLTPRFAAGPGFGSRLAFADVARGGVRQSELLEAVAHLFNLRFYTERATHTVFVEPADELFGTGPGVDWSAKSDLSEPVVRTRLAPGVPERRRWCYRPGDGPVVRAEGEAEPFGSWTFTAATFAAAEGTQVLRNGLFAPTLSLAGGYSEAPSALLLQVGDRDAVGEQGAGLTPRIVRYAGMCPLPDGERWGYPSAGGAYPLAAFHLPGDGQREGFTLCFEDRDGERGLHRHYDRQVGEEVSGERIALSLRLDPDEFAALFAPGTGAPDIRSVFRIDTGSGVVRARLHGIESYDPAPASVRCTFTRISDERP